MEEAFARRRWLRVEVECVGGRVGVRVEGVVLEKKLGPDSKRVVPVTTIRKGTTRKGRRLIYPFFLDPTCNLSSKRW